MGGNYRSDVMAALNDGIGGALGDLAGAILDIPGTTKEMVAYALSVGANLDMKRVARALWVSSSHCV